FVARAIASWSENPNIRVLGNKKAWRLSIVSFVLKHGDRYLHHNFAVALLNDLFGIQARGGCSCAGPYGHRLLGIDLTASREFEREIERGCEGVKPGWVRVNFNYFISETVFQFLLEAVHFVATHGWKLLPHYEFIPETGLWRNRAGRPNPAMKLNDLTYARGKLEYRSRRATEPEWVLSTYLDDARDIVSKAVAEFASGNEAVEPASTGFEHLRWFPLPCEVYEELMGHDPTTVGGAKAFHLRDS
ncbi:MAG: aminotransferase, partial [Myxococcales bacterium]|nr:aminotransferase [Myxococcales bacterium]